MSGAPEGRGIGLAVVTVVVLAVVVAATLYLFRDQYGEPPAVGVATDIPPSPAPSDAGRPSPTSGTAPGRYTAVKKPCRNLDVRALERILGPAGPNRGLSRDLRAGDGRATAIVCAADSGRPARNYVRLEVTVFDTAALIEASREVLRALET